MIPAWGSCKRSEGTVPETVPIIAAFPDAAKGRSGKKADAFLGPEGPKNVLVPDP